MHSVDDPHYHFLQLLGFLTQLKM